MRSFLWLVTNLEFACTCPQSTPILRWWLFPVTEWARPLVLFSFACLCVQSTARMNVRSIALFVAPHQWGTRGIVLVFGYWGFDSRFQFPEQMVDLSLQHWGSQSVAVARSLPPPTHLSYYYHNYNYYYWWKIAARPQIIEDSTVEIRDRWSTTT